MIMSLIQINKANSVNNIISVPMGEDVKLKESSSKELLGKFKFFPDEPKLNKKFIKNVERLVRSSLAYKEYCRYLNEDQGLINDVHNFNITNEETHYSSMCSEFNVDSTGSLLLSTGSS